MSNQQISESNGVNISSAILKSISWIIVFLMGGILYYTLEIIWRGYSHWSMMLCGSICFTAIYALDKYTIRLNLIAKAAICAVIITSVELLFGLIFNIQMGLNVWNYSHLPMNYKGQICLLFTVLWFSLSIPILWFCKLLRKKVFEP